MSNTHVTNIEGHTLLNLPGERSSTVFFEVDNDGLMSLRFINPSFAAEFINLAVMGDHVQLTLGYSPVLQEEVES